MIRALAVIVIACAAVFFTLYTPGDGPPGRTGETAPEALAGTSWALTEIGGEPVSRPAAGSTLSFDSEAGAVSGTGPCNSFSADIDAGEGSIVLGPIVATERACLPDTRMIAEAAYFAALRTVAGFVIDDAGLVLSDRTGAEVLRYEERTSAPVDTSLIGTRWSLGDLEGTPAFGLAFIAFNENGELSGQGPCNGFAGDYRLGPDATVDIQPLKTTRCWCEDFEREGQFLDALRRVETWRIDGERLLLEAGEATLLILEIAGEDPEPLRKC